MIPLRRQQGQAEQARLLYTFHILLSPFEFASELTAPDCFTYRGS